MKKSSREFNLKGLKTALVYDRVNKFGGAERVLLSLKKIFPTAPLYTLVSDIKKVTWAKDFTVIPSFFNKVPFLRSRHEALALVAPAGFESFNFDNFDLVISVTSSDAKGIITRPGTLHLCYCLTPTRYLWSGESTYRKHPGFGALDWVVKPVFIRVKKLLQNRDLVLSTRPDAYWSISNTVQNRVKKYYNRDSEVVYPGINYDFFSKGQIQKQDYYLLVARLVPYKRTDLVIKTFNKLEKPLRIIGTGSDEQRLKKLAKPWIRFLGAVDDSQLRQYYQEAKAVIFPQTEDYGLVPLEAQAAGTPVIAYYSGGAKETVINNQTGVFFNQQKASAIIRAIDTFEGLKFSPKVIRANAYRFREEIFLTNFKTKLIKLWNQYQTTSL